MESFLSSSEPTQHDENVSSESGDPTTNTFQSVAGSIYSPRILPNFAMQSYVLLLRLFQISVLDERHAEEFADNVPPPLKKTPWAKLAASQSSHGLKIATLHVWCSGSARLTADCSSACVYSEDGV